LAIVADYAPVTKYVTAEWISKVRVGFGAGSMALRRQFDAAAVFDAAA
jgi:hypothetical protein